MTFPDRQSRLTQPVRVGLLTPYFSFFDDKFPATFREDQARYASELAAALQDERSIVIPSGLVDSPETASSTGALFTREDVDVIVVAPLMAAPPGFVAPMLADAGRPIVIWLDDRALTIQPGITEIDATRGSGLLGSIMLASALRASGTAFHVVATGPREGGPVIAAARGASVRTMLSRLRLGLLGDPIPGYSDVELSEEAARTLGVSMVRVDPGTLAPTYPRPDTPADSLDALVGTPVIVTDDAAHSAARSVALWQDLDDVVEAYDLDALAINCHSDLFRWHPGRGVVGCLGASMLTSRGVPVACTGDAATAVALALATRLVGEEVQYCEGYLVGRSTGELLISSCGLANPKFGDPSSPPEIHGNELYPGACGAGCSFHMTFASGPATILGLAANSSSARPRFVARSGWLSGRRLSHMNGPAGLFSFDLPGDRSTSRSWVEAGPAHHVALARGQLDAELAAASAFVDADFVLLGTGRELPT